MGIFQLLLLLFLTVPIIEIFLLLEVGSLIGTQATIILIILTAVVGAFLVRAQGLSTFRRVQIQLQQAELPALELMEGMVVMVAGALLVTPGFFTDSIGFLCLIPAVRRFYLKRIIQRFIKPRFIYHADASGSQQHRTIDAEYWREDIDNKRKN